MENPFFSIIIRIKNEEEYLERVLNSVCNQETNYKYEVVIVDSGSKDNSLNIAKKFNVKLIEIPEEKFTYTYSLNQGISNSEGNIIVLLSGHTIPFNLYWLENLTKDMINDDNVAGVTGRQIPYPDADITEIYRLRNFKTHKEIFHKSFFADNIDKSISYDSMIFSNANCTIRRDILEKYPFKELPYGEDNQWAQEVLTYGYKIIYEPTAIVYHSHKLTIKETARKYFLALKTYHIINNKRIFRISFFTRPFRFAKNIFFFNPNKLSNKILWAIKGFLQYTICNYFLLTDYLGNENK